MKFDKLVVIIIIAIVLGVTLCVVANHSQTYNATLTIDGKSKGIKISDDLFGIFLEDINFAGDTLNPELIANKSFGYDEPLQNWHVDDNLVHEIINDGEQAICSTNTEFLRISNDYNTLFSIENNGYVTGFNFNKNDNFIISIYIRAYDYNGTLTAKICNDSTTFLETSFNITSSNEWVKYENEVKAISTVSDNAKFALIIGEGKMDIDVVSVESTNQIVGFRSDLANALKDLSPSFVRFPGGCLIEGSTLETAYNWKDSIGVNAETDLASSLTINVIRNGVTQSTTEYGSDATRATGGSIWHRDTDYGIGFYEYFMLCDYLGATAVPIVNAGVACQGWGSGWTYEGEAHIGTKEFEYYVDLALDLVLFAKGNVTSNDTEEAYWATVRTNMGHAEPFEMDYLGIGNEQWGDNYFAHYEEIRTRFLEKSKQNPIYASVELIVANGPLFNDTFASQKMALAVEKGYVDTYSDYGIVDEHYYLNYMDFLNNTNRYDSYSRDENTFFEVFVGEYSANCLQDLNGNENPVVYNSIQTATAEAAYMTGLERNGDVVRLAAYAPIFGNRDWRFNQWGVNLIYYTPDSFIPSCNYYVQQMFSKNKGDYLLDATLTFKKDYTDNIKSGLHYVTSIAENGDIIVKIVNTNIKNTFNINIAIEESNINGKIEVTELRHKNFNAVNQDEIIVSPNTYTLHYHNDFTYTAKSNSVTVLRFKTY